jgi:serine/threonine-protein kinase HipA
VTIARVDLWGRRIGAVSWEPGDPAASFEYDPGFRESGIEVAPLTMPLAPTIYQFPELPEKTFRGLPGLLADSLPDRYGDALIDAWLIRQGRPPGSFDAVERLCYTGTRGVGALEYQPETGPATVGVDIDVAELVELAAAVLSKRTSLDETAIASEEAMNRILQVGTSAGGARAKAVIAWNPETNAVRSGQAGLEPGFSHWILKFDGVASADDRGVGNARGYGLIEYAYYRMALAVGIEMTESRILEEGGRHHFMTRRFDRTSQGEKIHVQSLGGLAHFDYNAAGVYAYEQAIDCMRRLPLPPAAIEQQFLRAVFNVVARNQDDHVKNIAFLMDKTGSWSLSPAFDVIYAHNPRGAWTSGHQMTLNGKRDHFTIDDLIAFGRSCNLKPVQAKQVVREVTDVVARWSAFATDAEVPSDKVSAIRRHLRLDLASAARGASG